ncbi:MAG TPA: hypothetical protein VF919_15585, partial [Gemmatimonadales bacterium]
MVPTSFSNPCSSGSRPPGAWLIAQDLRANRTLSPAVLAGMLLESVLLALVFGVVVGSLTAAVLGTPAPPMVVGFNGQQLSR